MPGYRFIRWEGVSTSTSPVIEVIPQENSFLKAVFEPSELEVTTLVINEINYKSSASFDTEDWIEIYNPVSDEVDISGWKITDKNPNNVFIFPEGAKIAGNSYLVVCRDTSMFRPLHLNISNVYGNLSFGLSSDNESIRLLDIYGNLVDSVYYESSGEWTSLPNGSGPTLSLIDPQKDNTLAVNWRASGAYGTPGRLNDTYTDVEKEETVNRYDYHLYENYPNPFNPTTNIRYSVAAGGEVTLIVYDLLGREVETLVSEYMSAGLYEITWTAGNVPSGVYFVQLKSGSFVSSKKMVLLK
jgi:hypothetical protein